MTHTLKKVEVKQKTKGSNVKKPPMGIARQKSDKLVISVKSYDPETFRALVELVHYGSVLITEDTVRGATKTRDRPGSAGTGWDPVPGFSSWHYWIPGPRF